MILNKHLLASKIAFAFAILINVSLVSAQNKLIVDKVIAKVGGETVLLSEVETQFHYAASKFGEQDSMIKCQILENTIDNKIIVNQAKLDSIVVLEDEINERLNLKIESVLRQMNGDEAFFNEYYGASPTEMKEKLRGDEKSAMLAERMQGNLINSISVTPSEVVDFFNLIPTDSLPYLSSEVEISEIVYAPKVNEEEDKKAKELAEDIYQKLLAGEDFAALAKKYSDDPGSGAKGGDLGFAKRGSYVTEFEGVAFTLEQNEISEPVETMFGYHIIQMLERRGNNIKLRHILITPDITPADLELAKGKLDTIRAQILRNQIRFEQAVKSYSADESQGKNYSGRLRNPATGNTFYETKDLPTEIYFEIDNLGVGDISEPIEFATQRGETMFRIIKLDSRSNPHKANLEEDYAKIQQFAKENKKSEYFFNWIQEKKAETYIEVSQNYKFCTNIDGYVK